MAALFFKIGIGFAALVLATDVRSFTGSLKTGWITLIVFMGIPAIIDLLWSWQDKPPGDFGGGGRGGRWA